MTAPLRLSPIAPPPLPKFVRAHPGTLPGTVAGVEARGFSLDLAPVDAVRSSKQIESQLVERFTDALVNQVTRVDALQTRNNAVRRAAHAGEVVNATEFLTTAQKADLAFQLLMEIRNKLMDAYREVQQIQV